MRILFWIMQLVSNHKHYRVKWNCFSLLLIFLFDIRMFSAWIEESNIKDYNEFKDQLIKSSKTAAFKEAVQKIEEYISDPVVSCSALFSSKAEIIACNFITILFPP